MRQVVLITLLLPRNLVIVLLRGYRRFISPLYGDVCRYYPSCSAYGLGSVQQRGVIVGGALTLWRILRCNPWAAGGIDDVRAARHSRYRITASGFVVPARADSALAGVGPSGAGPVGALGVGGLALGEDAAPAHTHGPHRGSHHVPRHDEGGHPAVSQRRLPTSPPALLRKD